MLITKTTQKTATIGIGPYYGDTERRSKKLLKNLLDVSGATISYPGELGHYLVTVPWTAIDILDSSLD